VEAPVVETAEEVPAAVEESPVEEAGADSPAEED
jgi:hypothetical protein